MAPTIEMISTSQDRRTYAVDFFGEEVFVTVTSSCSVIRRWVHTTLYLHRYRRDHLIAGLGVQWTPDGSANPPADTLQLCVGHRCIVIQLAFCDKVPIILRRFLSNPAITCVGVWNHQDARKLSVSRFGLEVRRLLDIRHYVVDGDGINLKRSSFETIVEECLGHEGVRLDREISMSDWDDYVLSYDQILQACVDVFVCFKLGVEERLWKA